MQTGSQAPLHRGLNIACVCTPHAGHMIPMLNVAAALVKRGHRVQVFTCDYAVKSFENKARQVGAELMPLDMAGMTEEIIEKMAKDEKVHLFLILQRCTQRPLEQALAASQPDAVVADWCCLAGMQAAVAPADGKQVPLIINLPAPVSLLSEILDLMDPSTQFSFLGLHIARTRFSLFGFAVWSNFHSCRGHAVLLRECLSGGALMLIHTIWALDRVQPLLPNMVVTGPLVRLGDGAEQKLATERPDLHAFIHAGDVDGVVYVSTGTVVKLARWQVEAIFHGLKRAGCRVLWSLKEEAYEFLPCRDDKSFFIDTWMPQLEILQDSAVKAVVTHCGWGATLECVAAGKPVITVPFFGDQPGNAKLLVAAGAGEWIGKVTGGAFGKKDPYKEGDFTPDSVCAAVTKVLTDNKYKEQMHKLTVASCGTGGAELAAQHVEWAARFGTGHLRSPHFLRTSGKSPFSGVVLGFMIGLFFFGAYVARRHLGEGQLPLTLAAGRHMGCASFKVKPPASCAIFPRGQH